MSTRARRSPRAGHAALLFVLLTLLALLIVPVVVQQQVMANRQAIAVSEPARTLVARLQFTLVREAAALEDLLATNGREGAAVYDTTRANEDAIVRELETLVAELGPEVATRYAEARALLTRWHERVDTIPDAVRSGSIGGTPRELDLALLEQVLRANAAVDQAILRTTDQVRERIGDIERLGLRLSIALGVLAFLAAGAAAVLDERAHRFTAIARRRQEEAEAALEEVARANEARTRLLQGVTHDVKNPLGAAKGYAELLELGVRGPLAREQAALVQGVKRNVDAALAIITDLLDVARADSGGLTIKPVLVDLMCEVRAAVEDHRAAAVAAGHALELVATAESLPTYTDPGRVRQVLDNLLSNAIKYTPAPGRVTVVVDPDPRDDGRSSAGAWTVVRVMDTGPGIPLESREVVFDEFARLADGANVGGHGLGLAIARRVARLLGGDLTLADSPHGGATFELRLPRRGVETTEERRSEREPARS